MTPQGALAGVRVLITRPRERSSALATLLAAAGATPIEVPAIAIAPPESTCALDAALASVQAFDWVLFTSANAVRAFAERGRQLRVSLHPRRIAVVGPATARAVVESGLASAVDLVPERYVAESLAEALRPHAAAAGMLLVRAASARDVLPDTLREAGAAVTIATAYRNVVPQGAADELRHLFAEPAQRPDAVTFTSGSTATNLGVLLEEVGVQLPLQCALCSIGPVTSAAMRELGWKPAVEAREATLPSLVEAVTTYFAAQTRH